MGNEGDRRGRPVEGAGWVERNLPVLSRPIGGDGGERPGVARLLGAAGLGVALLFGLLVLLIPDFGHG